MLTPESLEPLVWELAKRPGHEKVRALLYRLLVEGLGADSQDIDFEKTAPEVHGRIDALLGRTVFELKSDLRRERRDAKDGLARYLTEREGQTGERFVGIATDGADFIAFFLRGDQLLELGAYQTDKNRPRDLLAWLQSSIALGEDLLPDPETIEREFGRESLAARRALDALDELWARAERLPHVRLKRELWNRLLSLAYGADVGDDALFLQHTYLVVVAKATAWASMIDTSPPDAEALLHGKAFSERGVAGHSEPDFFDWVLVPEGGSELVIRICRQVERFRLHDIRVDILKALYESLIDPETRHDLGEYYTPDWLAARIVTTAVTDPLSQRVMDPACGSGTFLFHAVRAVLEAAETSGLTPAEAVSRAADNIAGIDIHPVAVIFARVTWLLALMPALRTGRLGTITLPVYLGDALQWNLTRTGGDEAELELFAGREALEIYVPPVQVRDPEPRTLGPKTLIFPATVAADPQLLDTILTNMIDFGGRSEPASAFTAWMKHENSVSDEDALVLHETYDVMRGLQGEGRNHIWGYIARNLARPVWLSCDSQKADVVIGNPPWVSYRYMSATFQERFRYECRTAGLWVGGNVATQQDLSSYFYMRTANLYMRRDGRIALVMPYAALSRKAYNKFRKGEFSRFARVEFRLRFTKAWAFGPEVSPLFPVPSSTLFAEFDATPFSAPLPPQVLRFAGTLPRRDADRSEADTNLTEATAPWPTEASDRGGSLYREAFRQGATLTPRRFVLVEPQPITGMLPPNPQFPLIRGRVGNHDKAPWKTLNPPKGTVENKFLRPVLLGECIGPFRILKHLQAVIPWDEKRGRLMDANEAAEHGYSRLAQWLEKTESIWEQHKKSSMSLLARWDYNKGLSCQFPIAPLRVVYTKAGTTLAAAVTWDDSVVIDHTLYWAAVESPEEARFLCGILNSEALRIRVKQYQSQGQWGARHFDKYVFNLRIPRFSENDALHRLLAEATETAEDVANDVPKYDGESFTKTRNRIRAALRGHGIAAQLEQLAVQLLTKQ